jgi:hypothetical protein
VNRFHRHVRKFLAQICRDARVVDRHAPRGAHHDAQHRPAVVDRTAEAGHGILHEVASSVRVVVPEFPPVVVEPFLLEEVVCARLVQACVVQHDEARVRGHVSPHEVVAWRVAELVDDKIVGIAARLPEEVAGGLIGKAVDGVTWSQSRHELGAVGRDTGPSRRQR